MSFEWCALVACLLLIAGVVTVWAVKGAVKAAAVWIGNKIADLGGGSPRW